MPDRDRTVIDNADLRPGDIPVAGAPWDDIQRFALTFDGYNYWDSFEKCAEVANRGNPQNLVEFRTCLFFEQRRWRHFGEEPDAEAMKLIQTLVEGIRTKVGRGELC